MYPALGLDFGPDGTPYGASILIEKAMDPRQDVILALKMNGKHYMFLINISTKKYQSLTSYVAIAYRGLQCLCFFFSKKLDT